MAGAAAVVARRPRRRVLLSLADGSCLKHNAGNHEARKHSPNDAHPPGHYARVLVSFGLHWACSRFVPLTVFRSLSFMNSLKSTMFVACAQSSRPIVCVRCARVS